MTQRAAVEFRTSVRELVDFVHRKGDLGGDGLFRSSMRGVEGTRGHRRIQQSRGEKYQAEVPVDRVFERNGVKLHLSGRVDGILAEEDPPVVEEIKTVDGKWSGHPDPLHIAQLRVYAAILAQAHGWKKVEVRLTYLDLGTDLETVITDVETDESLGGFLDETLHEWFAWLVPRVEWLNVRNASVADLSFPYGNFRGGQRELARAVYRTIRDGGRLFVEAPTGLGKTLATLYPALRALPFLGDGQVFYLTAKTPGRLSAEQALEKLRQQGARVRSIMLTAKKKICFSENASGCDVRVCPFAIGYYDRIKPAVRELLAREHLDREGIEVVARAHQVCPFELSLDASLWTDVAVGDYNYAFDPSARLQRHFADGPPRHVVLVDEAHNMVDRSREMHSASLTVADLTIPAAAGRRKGGTKAKRAFAEMAGELTKLLETPPAKPSVVPEKSYHEGAMAVDAVPKELLVSLRQTSRRVEEFLVAQKPGVDVSAWLEPWFAIGTFLKTAEFFDENCRFILAPAEGRVTIFCADPSKRLKETLKGFRATVYFSATLSPMEYFASLLGGEETDPQRAYESPFLTDQMQLTVTNHDVTYKGRAASLSSVADAVAVHVRKHPGNHMIFCPSLQYLTSLETELAGRLEAVTLFAQHTAMDEGQRNAFLEKFQPGGHVAGLAVLGGIFAEGVDLTGDRLIGVTVIGVGLPRLSLERDILLSHFQKTREEGFDYAYRFPGMQRVLQAVGRLIRTEEDRGAALLIDQRFREPRYYELFPAWWRGG